MPEKHSKVYHQNHRIRRLTPERVAFGIFGGCPKGMPSQAVSSFLMEQFPVIDSGVCLPAGVMYGRIAGGAHAIVFDPHVKEVGKK